MNFVIARVSMKFDLILLALSLWCSRCCCRRPRCCCGRWCWCRRAASLFCLRLSIARVRVECPSRGKLAEFVTHHILAHKNWNELPAVMYADGEADHLGSYCRAPRPSAHHLLLA